MILYDYFRFSISASGHNYVINGELYFCSDTKSATDEVSDQKIIL